MHRNHLSGWICLGIFILFIICAGCSEEPDSINKPSTVLRTDTVVTGHLGPYWPGYVRGDCEFASHGPLVKLKARLYVESNVLMCSIYMYAQETEPDHTTAEGSWEELIYIAPTGWRINDIGLEPDSCETEYVDYNNDYDHTGCPGFRFASLGDTGGEDICNTTLDNTHVILTLDTLFVELIKN